MLGLLHAGLLINNLATLIAVSQVAASAIQLSQWHSHYEYLSQLSHCSLDMELSPAQTITTKIPARWATDILSVSLNGGMILIWCSYL